MYHVPVLNCPTALIGGVFGGASLREALAELTLAGEGWQNLETAEMMLRWLAEATRGELPPRRQEPRLHP